MPFPSSDPERKPPHGHDGTHPDLGLLSGQLVVTIEARTPVLIRGFGSAEAPEVPSRPRTGGSGREQIIPGSALHGAVRVLHETLTGSCLRVFDDEFVPSYRQTVDDPTIADLLMGVVSVAPESAPPTVRLCAPTGVSKPRLDQEVLHRLCMGVGLRAGDRLTVTLDDEGKPVDASRSDGGRWVVFITDSGARTRRYRAHIRQLTEEYKVVPPEVWITYLAAVRGADDLRPAERKKVTTEGPFAEVVFPKDGPGEKVSVGQRYLARDSVQVGQPLWLRTNGSGEIVEIRLGMVWRRPGAIKAGCRIPDGFHACHDPASLCPSCRLFGSADVRGRQAGSAQQRSYRGHVRFGDAVAMFATMTARFPLPPMGRPRPGAGQFYLSNPPEVVGDVGEPPLREWGSDADFPTRRMLRGRKFYWHTSAPPGQLPARGRARQQHQDKVMSALVVAFEAGSTFEATVTFTDLDRTQLGGLLAALSPRLALDGEVVQHVGGGRPLGFGSCSTTVDPDRSWVTSAADRYHGRAPRTLTDAEQSAVVAEFREVADREVWPALAKALRMDAVAPGDVWYPPGKGVRGSQSYDEGYQFWKQTAGAALGDEGDLRAGYPLTVLPDVSAASQSLPVVVEAKKQSVIAPRTRDGGGR